MAPVRIAAPGPRVGVARLDVPTEAGAEGAKPVRIEFQADGSTAQAFDGHGGRWCGRLADIKPDLHWALKRLEDGSYELTPVSVWYEFGRQVRHQQTAPAEPPQPTATGSRNKRHAEAGVAELEREVGLCKELNNRWEAMVERRQARQGSMLTAAAAREAIRSVARRTPVEVSKPKGGDRAYPDLEERVKDDTGLRKQQKKKKKALRREARAADEVEDEEVPETANNLLQLKPEQGEGGWEFSDKEEFSDDDEEKWEFDDQLECAAAGAEAPSADEDEGEEAERDLLTTHGRNIEMLLQQHGPEGEGAEGLGEADASSASEASEPETSQPTRPAPAVPAARAPPAAPVAPAAPARPAAPVLPVAQATRRAPRAEPRVRAEPPPRAAAPARPAAAQRAPRTSAPEPEAPAAPTREQLRLRLIDCLVERGGTCRAQDAMLVLGLNDRSDSAFYKEVLGLLKEVTTVERAGGDGAQRVLVLKPQFKAQAKARVVP